MDGETSYSVMELVSGNGPVTLVYLITMILNLSYKVKYMYELYMDWKIMSL
jgi:hypothetical protein